MKVRVTSHGRSGRRDAASEDSFYTLPLEDGGVLGVLSDGVGSGRDPKRCSERTVRLVADGFAARPRQWTVRRVFDRLVEQVNSSLYEEGRYVDGTHSMQATLSAVCIHHNRLHGCNAGDSPVLLIREGKVERLSENHLVTERHGSERLTRAIGMGPDLEAFHFTRELQQGDLVLLHSDGLTKLMEEQSLVLAILKYHSARLLIEEAMQRGTGSEIDDLSVILIEIEEVEKESLQISMEEPLKAPAKGMDHDGYQLVQPLGGNPRVWLAKKNGKRWVLKFVPEEAETDQGGIILSRFAAERWTACSLNSPLFVASHLPESGSSHYYVMDYLDAPSLRFVLKSGRLGVDEAIELGRFLCRAGEYLLRRELVHGDIKPENLLVLQEGGQIDFKLLDLGLASPIFTDNGVSGTPTYMAPERFRGAAVTERTEIFSIGATLYEALCGRPPNGRIERFQKAEFRRVTRPSRLNPNIPTWLDEVILKCLSINQSKRIQCYSELRYLLDHPEQVSPFTEVGEPLIERNPLFFYKSACGLLLLIVIVLLCKILSSNK